MCQKVSKTILTSSCLRENRNCSGKKEFTRIFRHGKWIMQNGPSKELTQIKLHSKNPCQFPFIHKNVKYKSCTKMDHEKLWCATTVNTTNHVTSWGYCTDSCSLEEG